MNDRFSSHKKSNRYSVQFPVPFSPQLICVQNILEAAVEQEMIEAPISVFLDESSCCLGYSL